MVADWILLISYGTDDVKYYFLSILKPKSNKANCEKKKKHQNHFMPEAMN